MESFPSKSDAAKPLGVPDRASDEPRLNGTEQRLGDKHGRLVSCPLDHLRPHPSYVRHHLTVPACQLSALVSSGNLAFQDPLLITRDRLILDGYARWELARKQGRPTLPCIEYDLTEAEALHCLLQRHRRSTGLNDFCRILLALDLEPLLKEKARANQQSGGLGKGLSKLTEASRVNVRSEIAAVAGVSVGNVAKVKDLKMTADPELQRALRDREISIHQAWLWRKLAPERQREELRLYRARKGIREYARARAFRHRRKSSPTVLDVGDLLKRLSGLESSELGSVGLLVIKGRDKCVFVTEGLLEALPPYQEAISTCMTEMG